MWRGSFLGQLTLATLGCALALVGSGFRPAAAIPLTYDEAADGDLPTFPSGATLALGLGSNTVAGSITFANSAPVPDDPGDSFTFTVPTGGLLTGIVIDIALRDLGSGSFNGTDFILDSAPSVTIPIPSTDLAPFTGILPLGPGSYALQNAGFDGAIAPGDFRIADYTWTFTVQPTGVPEPASLALLAVGLLAAGALRPRRTTAI